MKKSQQGFSGGETFRAASVFGRLPYGIDARIAEEHAAWLAKYTPVEREIFAAQERRLEARMIRSAERATRFGDSDRAYQEYLLRTQHSIESFWTIGELLCPFSPSYVVTRTLRAAATRVIDDARRRFRRPLYYAQENERRRALANERRKIRRRSTTSACPTKEQILDAWINAKSSHAATIRFGSLIEDLECYLDNSLRRNEDGVIIGRNPGVKGWLEQNIPALFARYTTVMRYKAAAKKLRQIAGVSDPTPAAAIVAEMKNTHTVIPALSIVRARAIWLEVTERIASNPTSLIARLDALIDPGRIEEANMLSIWRKKYESEITVRTKNKWWKRLRMRGVWRENSGKRNACKQERKE